MKKITICLVLFVLLATVLSIPVYASELDLKESIVRAVSDSEVYEWTIPAVIDIDGTTTNSTGSFNIEVTPKTLAIGDSVGVYFHGSANNFYLVKQGATDIKVPYTLYCQGNSVDTVDQVVLSGVTSYDHVQIAATLGGNISVTGTYTDTIGFYANITNSI